ncbi:uncharacterized protein F5Z01DRAFT_63468 [Emericellopsis atlantica]|uniref:HFB protein n=1 Tax=Emericellopsis atlantica TaxID=2614577 RepID=A0A9P8CPW5_9HYPO|nr:uncharacterized protein F5Z01DRAFT_63468 [Emericellopsis atlantica]KAG9254983.1 hypothetical protein F5Z01DRAFT_63468 [Emericellopsis atlantica]
MRFTSALVAGSLAFVASAQSTTASLSPAQTSQVACIKDCDADDLACIARCSPVPNPNEDQVEATHNCISKCYDEHGQGTAESIQAFSQCQNRCIAADYWNSSEGTPKPTGAVGGGSSGDKEESSTAATDMASATTTVTTGTATVTETGTATESPSESGSSTETTGSDGAAETGGNGDNAAAGLLAKTAAIVGAFAAVFAL